MLVGKEGYFSHIDINNWNNRKNIVVLKLISNDKYKFYKSFHLNLTGNVTEVLSKSQWRVYTVN